MRALLVTVLMLVLAATAQASPVLMPTEADLPPLALKYQHVKTTIDNTVAVTKVDQVFVNNTPRQLEATYVFPLPKGGSLTDFALWINGQRTKGEMMERQKARGIYEEIVRRRRDPGLLEYLGEDLFQARVFPVPANGEQRVELTYQQQLAMESGLAEYRYPLKALVASPPQELTIEVTVNSQVPLRSVYSPTHSVAVRRDGEKSARVSFEQARYVADTDFSLFCAVSEKDFGLNLLCSKKPGEDGTFLLMLAPKQTVDQNAVINRDLCFVLDTSGSMQGDKMKQAQSALKFCVHALNAGDRFNIVKFSTDVENFAPRLVEASKDQVEKACQWIDRLEALGGTAIDDAVTEAFRQVKESERPSTVVFMTDGKPTVGNTDTSKILENAKAANTRQTRLFVLGVGDDLNAKLLDQLAGDNRGLPVYIGPKEDLEVKVGDFYGKISHPVLADLSLDFGSIEAVQVYPDKLPDLYKGSQLAVYGRYKEGGDTTIKLTGKVNDRKVEFSYPAKFAKEELEREFIPRLWATRRVGHLLEKIRQSGEQEELKDEVITLAKRHGIVTPYTAYLVVEDESQLALQPSRPMPMPAMPREDEGGIFKRMFSAPAPSAQAPGAPLGGAAPESRGEGDALYDAASAPEDKGASGSAGERAKLKESIHRFVETAAGADGVALSKAVQEMKQADAPGKAERTVARERTVEGRTFKLESGVWIDSAYKPGLTELKVKYGSEAYFDLVMARTELKKVFALGTKLILVVGGKALIIGDEGQEKLSAAELEAFFGPK